MCNFWAFFPWKRNHTLFSDKSEMLANSLWKTTSNLPLNWDARATRLRFKSESKIKPGTPGWKEKHSVDSVVNSLWIPNAVHPPPTGDLDFQQIREINWQFTYDSKVNRHFSAATHGHLLIRAPFNSIKNWGTMLTLSNNNLWQGSHRRTTPGFWKFHRVLTAMWLSGR